ncbi:sensor histidine kinase [Hamadaea tsunoensis]|uniref:sensor histidine kinase n=1 Tax=Hamadaea tsunoensis TaxID=53368 RepID=UPI0004297707|nr:histidine kinase [Hamadaea tsunoensis]
MSYLLPALASRRYLITVWPWRAVAYLVSTVPLSMVLGGTLSLFALPVYAVVRDAVDGKPITAVKAYLVLVSVVFAGLIGVPAAIFLAAVERRRLAMIDDRPVAAHRNRVLQVLYLLFLAVVVPFAYFAYALLALLAVSFIASPFVVHPPGMALGVTEVHTVRETIPYAIAGVLMLPVLLYVAGMFGAVQGMVTRALLTGDGSAELREVSRSRARLVDAYEAERRRIERDLHDGAQHRLTSLTLQIGLARLDVPADSPAAAPLAQAHEQAKQLMVVLRDLVVGIRPQSLTDLGLPGALRELADQSAIPVHLVTDVGRLPERVEGAAYFAVSEALANVAKHAGATRIDLSVTRRGRLLAVEVRDDGRGGADPARGTGLVGLADRVGAVGGRLLLSSPVGGPTLVRVELPCE